MKEVLLIGFGGFLGSVSRFYFSRLNVASDFTSIPLGTFTVNILGSFILGLLTGMADRNMLLSPGAKLFLMVGFCGGFTTFSTFAAENLMIMKNEQFFHVLLYSGLSLFLGFIAVYLGYLLSKSL